MLVMLLGAIGPCSWAQYNVGDFGSGQNGNWTSTTTWRTWNGAAWVATGSLPNSGSTVFIRTGHTVVVNGSGPYSLRDLTVEAGARLWSSNNATGIAPVGEVAPLAAWPVPVEGDHLFLDRPVSGVVVDMCGRTVAEVVRTGVLDVRSIATGSYLLRTTDGVVLRFMRQ